MRRVDHRVRQSNLSAASAAPLSEDDEQTGYRKELSEMPTNRFHHLISVGLLMTVGLFLVLTAQAGLTAAASGTPDGDRLLGLIQSKPTPLDVQAPAWSPDGRTIVFVSWRDGNGEVYAMDADGSGPRNLTQNPAKVVRPSWSPDGRSIAFVSSRNRQSEIYVMNADGSGKRSLTRHRANDDLPTWSPDRLDLPTWSPDGRRIAFLRPATRRYKMPGRDVIRRGYHLYVVNADGSGLRNLTSN
jgi:dipeptidyl aminopeptidase/acylaminoacyl peptidase